MSSEKPGGAPGAEAQVRSDAAEQAEAAGPETSQVPDTSPGTPSQDGPAESASSSTSPAPEEPAPSADLAPTIDSDADAPTGAPAEADAPATEPTRAPAAPAETPGDTPEPQDSPTAAQGQPSSPEGASPDRASQPSTPTSPTPDQEPTERPTGWQRALERAQKLLAEKGWLGGLIIGAGAIFLPASPMLVMGVSALYGAFSGLVKYKVANKERAAIEQELSGDVRSKLKGYEGSAFILGLVYGVGFSVMKTALAVPAWWVAGLGIAAGFAVSLAFKARIKERAKTAGELLERKHAEIKSQLKTRAEHALNTTDSVLVKVLNQLKPEQDQQAHKKILEAVLQGNIDTLSDQEKQQAEQLKEQLIQQLNQAIVGASLLWRDDASKQKELQCLQSLVKILTSGGLDELADDQKQQFLQAFEIDPSDDTQALLPHITEQAVQALGAMRADLKALHEQAVDVLDKTLQELRALPEEQKQALEAVLDKLDAVTTLFTDAEKYKNIGSLVQAAITKIDALSGQQQDLPVIKEVLKYSIFEVPTNDVVQGLEQELAPVLELFKDSNGNIPEELQVAKIVTIPAGAGGDGSSQTTVKLIDLNALSKLRQRLLDKVVAEPTNQQLVGKLKAFIDLEQTFLQYVAQQAMDRSADQSLQILAIVRGNPNDPLRKLLANAQAKERVKHIFDGNKELLSQGAEQASQEQQEQTHSLPADLVDLWQEAYSTAQQQERLNDWVRATHLSAMAMFGAGAAVGRFGVGLAKYAIPGLFGGVSEPQESVASGAVKESGAESAGLQDIQEIQSFELKGTNLIIHTETGETKTIMFQSEEAAKSAKELIVYYMRDKTEAAQVFDIAFKEGEQGVGALKLVLDSDVVDEVRDRFGHALIEPSGPFGQIEEINLNLDDHSYTVSQVTITDTGAFKKLMENDYVSEALLNQMRQANVVSAVHATLGDAAEVFVSQAGDKFMVQVPSVEGQTPAVYEIDIFRTGEYDITMQNAQVHQIIKQAVEQTVESSTTLEDMRFEPVDAFDRSQVNWDDVRDKTVETVGRARGTVKVDIFGTKLDVWHSLPEKGGTQLYVFAQGLKELDADQAEQVKHLLERIGAEKGHDAVWAARWIATRAALGQPPSGLSQEDMELLNKVFTLGLNKVGAIDMASLMHETVAGAAQAAGETVGGVLDAGSAADYTPVPDAQVAENFTPLPDMQGGVNYTPLPDGLVPGEFTPQPDVPGGVNYMPVDDGQSFTWPYDLQTGAHFADTTDVSQASEGGISPSGDKGAETSASWAKENWPYILGVSVLLLGGGGLMWWLRRRKQKTTETLQPGTEESGTPVLSEADSELKEAIERIEIDESSQPPVLKVTLKPGEKSQQIKEALEIVQSAAGRGAMYTAGAMSQSDDGRIVLELNEDNRINAARLTTILSTLLNKTGQTYDTEKVARLQDFLRAVLKEQVQQNKEVIDIFNEKGKLRVEITTQDQADDGSTQRHSLTIDILKAAIAEQEPETKDGILVRLGAEDLEKVSNAKAVFAALATKGVLTELSDGTYVIEVSSADVSNVTKLMNVLSGQRVSQLPDDVVEGLDLSSFNEIVRRIGLELELESNWSEYRSAILQGNAEGATVTITAQDDDTERKETLKIRFVVKEEKEPAKTPNSPGTPQSPQGPAGMEEVHPEEPPDIEPPAQEPPAQGTPGAANDDAEPSVSAGAPAGDPDSKAQPASAARAGVEAEEEILADPVQQFLGFGELPYNQKKHVVSKLLSPQTELGQKMRHSIKGLSQALELKMTDEQINDLLDQLAGVLAKAQNIDSKTLAVVLSSLQGVFDIFAAALSDKYSPVDDGVTRYRSYLDKRQRDSYKKLLKAILQQGPRQVDADSLVEALKEFDAKVRSKLGRLEMAFAPRVFKQLVTNVLKELAPEQTYFPDQV